MKRIKRFLHNQFAARNDEPVAQPRPREPTTPPPTRPDDGAVDTFETIDPISSDFPIGPLSRWYVFSDTDSISITADDSGNSMITAHHKDGSTQEFVHEASDGYFNLYIEGGSVDIRKTTDVGSIVGSDENERVSLSEGAKVSQVDLGDGNDSLRVSVYDGPGGFRHSPPIPAEQDLSWRAEVTGGVYLGAGDDEFISGGVVNAVHGGDGRDALFNIGQGHIIEAHGDGGDDIIFNQAEIDTVTGGEGADSILNGHSYLSSYTNPRPRIDDVDGGPGDDSVEIYRGYIGQTTGGDGQDSLGLLGAVDDYSTENNEFTHGVLGFKTETRDQLETRRYTDMKGRFETPGSPRDYNPLSDLLVALRPDASTDQLEDLLRIHPNRTRPELLRAILSHPSATPELLSKITTPFEPDQQTNIELQKIAALAADSADFQSFIENIYGEAPGESIERLRQKFLSLDAAHLPKAVILPDLQDPERAWQQAEGTYHSFTDAIWLPNPAALDGQDLSGAYLEGLGHWIEYQLHPDGTDVEGDEGELFRISVQSSDELDSDDVDVTRNNHARLRVEIDGFYPVTTQHTFVVPSDNYSPPPPAGDRDFEYPHTYETNYANHILTPTPEPITPPTRTVDDVAHDSGEQAEHVAYVITNSTIFQKFGAAADAALSVGTAVASPWTIPAAYDHLQEDFDTLFGVELPKDPFWESLWNVEGLAKEGIHAAAKFFHRHIVEPEVRLDAELLSAVTGVPVGDAQAALDTGAQSIEDFIVGFAEGSLDVVTGTAEMLADPVGSAENIAKLVYLIGFDRHALWTSLTADLEDKSNAEAAGIVTANILSFFVDPAAPIVDGVQAAVRGTDALLATAKGVRASMEAHEFELAKVAEPLRSTEDNVAPHQKLLDERTAQSSTADSMLKVLEGQTENLDTQIEQATGADRQRLVDLKSDVEDEMRTWVSLETNNQNQLARFASEASRARLNDAAKALKVKITPYEVNGESHLAIKPGLGAADFTDPAQQANLLHTLEPIVGDLGDNANGLSIGSGGRVHIDGLEDTEALLRQADRQYEPSRPYLDLPAGGTPAFDAFTDDLKTLGASGKGAHSITLADGTPATLVRSTELGAGGEERFAAAEEFLNDLRQAQGQGKPVVVLADDFEKFASKGASGTQDLWDLNNWPAGKYIYYTPYQRVSTTLERSNDITRIKEVESTLTTAGYQKQSKRVRQDSQQLTAWHGSNDHLLLDGQNPNSVTGKRKFAADAPGHLIGAQFGGGTNPLNLIPQDAGTNNSGHWKQYEVTVLPQALKRDDITVKYTMNYDGDGNRPGSFDVTASRVRDGSTILTDASGQPTSTMTIDNPKYSDETYKQIAKRPKGLAKDNLTEIGADRLDAKVSSISKDAPLAVHPDMLLEDQNSWLDLFKKNFDGSSNGHQIDPAKATLRYIPLDEDSDRFKVIIRVDEAPPARGAQVSSTEYNNENSDAGKFVSGFTKNTGIEVWFSQERPDARTPGAGGYIVKPPAADEVATAPGTSTSAP